MKHSHAFPSFWTSPAATLAGIALTACASAVSGQVTLPLSEAQSSAPTVLLNGPTGSRSTLVHSVDAGWRLYAGWPAEIRSNAARSMNAALSTPGALPADEQSALEHPLTVFVDGLTGYTFIYVFEEGWKFIGRVADTSR